MACKNQLWQTKFQLKCDSNRQTSARQEQNQTTASRPRLSYDPKPEAESLVKYSAHVSIGIGSAINAAKELVESSNSQKIATGTAETRRITPVAHPQKCMFPLFYALDDRADEL